MRIGCQFLFQNIKCSDCIVSKAKLFSEIKSNVRLQHGLLKRLIGVCVLLVTSAWDKICLQAQAFIEYMKGAW